MSCRELAARLQVRGAQGDDLVAVDEVPAIVDGEHAVGVAVERDAQVGCPGATTAVCSSSGWVDPQPLVDVAPVGPIGDDRDVGAEPAEDLGSDRRRGAVGAVDDDLEAGQGAALDRADHEIGVGVDHGGIGRRSTRSPAPVGPLVAIAVEDRGDRRPRPRLLGVGQLAAARGEDLDAVVGERVVRLAEITTPGTPSRADPAATAGVGTTPSATASAPSAHTPAAIADSNNGPETAGVATEHDLRGREHPHAGAADGQRHLGGEVDVGDATHAVGAEAHRGGR